MNKDKAIKQAHAEELYNHCLSASGVYEAFEKMIEKMGLQEVFPGFENVKRELQETMKTIERECRGD